jgi:hypothetical protein
MSSNGASRKRGARRIKAGAVRVPRVAVIMADPIMPSAISRSNRTSQSTGVEWSTDSGGSYSASWRIWLSDIAASRQTNAPMLRPKTNSLPV